MKYVELVHNLHKCCEDRRLNIRNIASICDIKKNNRGESSQLMDADEKHSNNEDGHLDITRNPIV